MAQVECPWQVKELRREGRLGGAKEQVGDKGD